MGSSISLPNELHISSWEPCGINEASRFFIGYRQDAVDHAECSCTNHTIYILAMNL